MEYLILFILCIFSLIAFAAAGFCAYNFYTSVRDMIKDYRNNV